MPTNEERRQVSAKLRETEIECILGWEYSAHLGVPISECARVVSAHEILVERALNRLADLIEPEPERTCHNIHPDVFQCSECYAMDDDWVRPNFCPICGAKVVE